MDRVQSVKAFATLDCATRTQSVGDTQNLCSLCAIWCVAVDDDGSGDDTGTGGSADGTDKQPC